MTASSVILRGFKGGTIVTRGYSPGEAVIPAQAGIDTFGADNRRRQSERRKKLRMAADLREMFFPRSVPPESQSADRPQNVSATVIPISRELPYIPNYVTEPERLSNILMFPADDEAVLIMFLLS